jgi:imidazolonepropionase-like amidohydrolase
MPAEARDRARYLLDHGADFIKLIATGAVLALGSEPGALELSPEEMKAACDEAKLRGSYCIAHAHGAEGIKAAIRAGARTIEHASYLDAEGSRSPRQMACGSTWTSTTATGSTRSAPSRAGRPNICARISRPPTSSGAASRRR